MAKRLAFDLQLVEWEEWVATRGFPRYRAGQIYAWLVKGVQHSSQMKNLPKPLLEALEEDFILKALEIEGEWVSQKDDTRKFVFQLWDGQRIETVLMGYHHGYSVCISSQAGCRMGCRFCASAAAGFGRNLSAGEMLGQITVIAHHLGITIRNVVVMGIGEPFDNYSALEGFLFLANDPKGLNLGARHITVSTCGLVPQMLKFIEINLQVNLSVSLHGATQALRESMMPIAEAYDLETLMAACKEYTDRTGRRLTFEYSLFEGVNDSAADAKALGKLLKGIHCHVNLIAANEFEGSSYRRSSSAKVKAFQETLEALRINATLRREMGTDIMAACGQLRRGMQEK